MRTGAHGTAGGKLAAVVVSGLVAVWVTACGTGAAVPGPAQDPGAAGPASAAPAAAAPSDAPDGPEGGEHNVVDFYFAQRMLPHHAQAVRMAELAPDRASDDAVADLAEEIGETLTAEAAGLEEWLTERGLEQPPPEAFADGHPSHSGMPGMLNALQMNLLADTSGEDFDETFLTFMIAHHEGSVAMAAPVLENGLDPAARDIATAITQRQEHEIAAMRDLLDD
ncbi:DUF305 domain-containing protein [Jiangella mangrovi]|uniref:Uncharacterized protein (DUF305 family) n=1 Tax=Jiangella mangrovi TaxID=1524084 RepID=A0A7W9GSI6_9ACTN|nr:uncharacterized protein (DUF305 family) [Jiangella mangrovi]